MSKYIRMVDSSEDELMHYGVLGMKWHHHKAKGYYNKMMKYKSSAQNKMNSAVQAVPKNGEFGKESKKLLKSGYKDLETANKYLRKHNKYVDKMEAGFDEERDKVMKSKKYSTLQKQIDNGEEQKRYLKKSLDRGDYADAFEADEKWVEKQTKLNESLGMKTWEARQMAVDEASDNGAGKWITDTKRYNSDVATVDDEINKAKRKQDKMTDKVEKKRKKYVSFVY